MIPSATLRRAGLTAAALVIVIAVARAQEPASSQAMVDLRAEVERLTTAKDWTALRETLPTLIASAHASGDAAAEAEALRRLALTHHQLKAYESARPLLEQALAIHVQRGDRLSSGQLRDDLGVNAYFSGQPTRVRDHHAAAAEDFAAVGRVDRQVNSLRNMIFSRLLSASEMVAVLERAVTLSDSITDRRLKGLVRHQLGDVLNIAGDYDRAIVEIEAAVRELGSAGASGELANALTSLGRTYRMHGLPDRAIDTYRRVLELQTAANDQQGMAQTYDAIAVAHNAAKRSIESRAAEERAVQLARASNSPSLPYFTINLADALIKAGEPSRAVAMIEPLMAGAPAQLEKSARRALASAYRALNRLADARSEADKAVAAAEAAGDHEFLILNLYQRSLIHADLKDVDAAVRDATAALEGLETLRAKAAPRDAMKESFVDQHRQLIALAVRLRRDLGDAAGAFEIAEKGRARAFQDLLASRQLSRSPGTPVTDLPSAAAVPSARINDVASVLRQSNATLVSYWVEPDETTIWVVTPAGTVSAARVAVKADRFGELTRRIWQGSAPKQAQAASASVPARGDTRLTLSADARPALRELYRLLMAPIESRLPADGTQLITIVPHGPLFSVPFAALIDARDRYLIEQHRLHYVPSAALLQAPAPSPAKGRGVLLVADPSPMPIDDRAPLPALPGARAEVKSLSALLPSGDSQTLIGSAATESRVRDASRGQRAVHLATHGIVFDDRPFDSYLALAREGSADDGRLTAADVYAWHLNADLVVLSGCRTARGRLSGDGIQGLARAFFYAGTPSVIATLWDLPDAPAQYLFPEFYRRWLAGADRSTALRDAQLSLIRALRRGVISVTTPLGVVKLPEHPAIWASPVLLGQP